MLHISRLCKTDHSPAKRSVLRDITLDLAPGDFIAVLGEPAAGKSALLNLIAGLDLPDSGTVKLHDVTLTGLDDHARLRLRRRHMGFIFQSHLLLPHLTALDNAALSLKLNGIAHREAQQRAYAALTAVGLASAMHRFPSSLSAGESQRIAIARALAHQPQLVLADEPTGSLDDETAKSVLSMLRKQIKLQQSIGILVTRSVTAATSADRIYHLDRSELRPA